MSSITHHQQPKMQANRTSLKMLWTEDWRWVTDGNDGGGGHTGASRHFGGSSRASCRSKMPIRRLTPSHPPAISAENMQFVQQML